MPFRRSSHHNERFLQDFIDLGFMTRGPFVPIDDFDYGDDYFRDREREPWQQYRPPSFEYEPDPYDQYSRSDYSRNRIHEMNIRMEDDYFRIISLLRQLQLDMTEFRNIATMLERRLREVDQHENNRKVEPTSKFYENIVIFGGTAMVSMVVFWFLNRK